MQTPSGVFSTNSLLQKMKKQSGSRLIRTDIPQEITMPSLPTQSLSASRCLIYNRKTTKVWQDPHFLLQGYAFGFRYLFYLRNGGDLVSVALHLKQEEKNQRLFSTFRERLHYLQVICFLLDSVSSQPKKVGSVLVNPEYMDGASLLVKTFKKEKWYYSLLQ
ncbi:hypothetical protein B296_00044578 [Ensete ventricosum]|uniref:Uncharacterized protein n=1 Tax=Ensete ventricosum TaxID=4639 RepID=A0A426ZAE5_ENSVE|nr:hypothetical protein B296_00044578 [Ensete ventricosum]